MNVKIITIGLLVVIALYGMNTVFADNTSDESTPVQVGTDTQCDDPLYDGSGYDNVEHTQGKSGNQRGTMDGSMDQLRNQLKDGSGLGGMYGENAGTGDCIEA